MNDEFVLPLFPLSISVLPGEVIPLHIFEERYKELMSYCLENPRMRPFGVTMVVQTGNQAHLCQTGSALIVDEVLERYPDGRLDILARGVGRIS